MKKLFYLLPLSLLLTACPIGLDYAPGDVGKEKINKELEGTWEFQATDTDKDAEVLKVTFKKTNDSSFDVYVDTRGEMYSLDDNQLTGYETKIEDLNVLYLKPLNENKYYCYQYKLIDKKTMEIADIPLLDGGIDAVKSTESLRQQIKASMQKPEFRKEVKTYKKVK